MTTTHDFSVQPRVEAFLKQGKEILERIEKGQRPIPEGQWKSCQNLLETLPLPTQMYEPIAYRLKRLSEQDELACRFELLAIERKIQRYFARYWRELGGKRRVGPKQGHAAVAPALKGVN